MTNSETIRRIEQNEQNKLLRKVVDDYGKEVRDFYDLYTWIDCGAHTRGLHFREFRLEDEKPEKIGKTPIRLVELLDVDKTLDVNKLRYEDVRGDYQNREEQTAKSAKVVTGLGLIGLAGIAAGITLRFNDRPELGLASYFIGLGSYCGISLIPKPKLKGLNGGFDEYVKLCEMAERIDSLYELKQGR